MGSSSYLCSLPPPLYHPSCEGHLGDSEAIAIDVYYVVSTQHWVAHTAWLSEHGNFVEVPKTSKPYPHRIIVYPPGAPPITWNLEYPSHPGAYMRVYVSQGKHANYVSQGHCDAGGTLGIDTCDGVDTHFRDGLSYLWNLGSRAHPFLTCVEARSAAHEFYGSGTLECFWSSSTRFRGWYPLSEGGLDAGPYSDVLAILGF